MGIVVVDLKEAGVNYNIEVATDVAVTHHDDMYSITKQRTARRKKCYGLAWNVSQMHTLDRLGLEWNPREGKWIILI